MNKELKALKEIRECLYGDVYAGVERKLDIIESALKDINEIFENHNIKSFAELNERLCDYNELKFDDNAKKSRKPKKIVGTTTVDKALEPLLLELCPDVKKKLKAFDTISKDYEKVMKELSKEIEKNRVLEIIKEKVSDINWFKCCSSLEQYNAGVPSYKRLAQEEYNLLKEVLL